MINNTFSQKVSGAINQKHITLLADMLLHICIDNFFTGSDFDTNYQ